MLEHGGRLLAAAREYGIPASEWLDLSTGVNPNGWPVPPIPPELWARLPEDDDALTATARSHYGAEHLLPVAGTQAAIQALPKLRAPCRVGVLEPAYAEHAHAWRGNGHQVIAFTDAPPIDALDVLLLVHPNNPTGRRYEKDQLLAWHARLAARGGWLIVDEAFLDAAPQASLTAQSDRAGLIVLRGIGKFFGLPGARVGFVMAERALIEPLQEILGPWSVTGPSRFLAQRALADRDWQARTRERLTHEGARLARLLADHGLAPDGGTELFQWVRTARAEEIQQRLAQLAILVRRFDAPASLRFGLPGSEAQWQRLARALAEIPA